MTITGADYEKVMALNAKGLTNTEIAAATGVSSRTVSRMRNGQWEPPSPASMPLLGRSPLTGVIEKHMEAGYTLDELTVLARDNDPFRQDRDEGHKLGRWLADTLEGMGFEVGEGGRTITLQAS
jgi:transcriptional regulator with XRE-family HTH domain